MSVRTLDRPCRRMTPCRHLVIFARVPVAGGGKRRLAAGIGPIRAVQFERIRLAALLATLGRDRRWRTWLAVTPDRSGHWPGGLGIIGQGRGDLGRRLARVARAMPPGPVVIIGTDSPDASRSDIGAAFRALGGHDAVLGPACDGGYWLIGLRRAPRLRLPFTRVRWSSPDTFADTVREIGGARLAVLRRLGDVDDAASLAAHPHWARRVRARAGG